MMRLLSKSIGRMPALGAVCAWAFLAAPAYSADVVLSFLDQEKQTDVSNVVVNLTALDGQNPPALPAVDFEVNQYRQAFDPLVSTVPINSGVRFRNSDSFAHHVYSFSKAKAFEQRQSTRGVTDIIKLDKPGLIALGCNIHDHMLAYIYVSESPFYGLSDKDGGVRLENVPDGTYTLKIWHPRLRGKAIEEEITIAGETLEMRHRLDLKPPRKVKKSLYSR